MHPTLPKTTTLPKTKMFFPAAAAAVIALAVSGAALASPAQAAEVIVTDQEFVLSGGWGPNLQNGANRFAQPFIPNQSGALDEVPVTVWSSEGAEFRSLAIHRISTTGMVSDEPIAGGEGVLSFATWPSNEALTQATATFPERPTLDEGDLYAIVIDPKMSSSPGAPSASFPMAFSSDHNYFVTSDGPQGWGSNGYTGHIFFGIRLAVQGPDVSVVPIAPQLQPSTQCGALGTVTTEEQEGVVYTQDTVGTRVTVTATPASGYVFPAEADVHWSFSIAADDCPTLPTVVSTQQPILVQPSCDAEGSVTPAQTAGVQYVVTRAGTDTIVTAAATAGYALAPGSVTEWTYKLEQRSCAPAISTTSATYGGKLAQTGASTAASETFPMAATLMGSLMLLSGGVAAAIQAGRRSTKR